MWISEQARAGFAVAAALASDQGAERALSALEPGAKAIAGEAERVATMGPAQRRQRMAALIGKHRAKPTTLPQYTQGEQTAELRATALLAPQLEARLGRQAVAHAPMPRAGFGPEPELLNTLFEIWRDIQTWPE